VVRRILTEQYLQFLIPWFYFFMQVTILI